MRKIVLFSLLLESCRTALPTSQETASSPAARALDLRLREPTLAVVPVLLQRYEAQPVEKRHDLSREPLNNVARAFRDLPTSDYALPSFEASIDHVRLYFLPHYTLGTIPLENVYLTFYRGKLVQLKCSSTPALRQQMNYRYGMPQGFEERENVLCIGSATQAPDSTKYMVKRTMLWQTGDADSTVYSSVRQEYLDLNCQMQLVETFTMKSPPEVRQMYRTARAIKTPAHIQALIKKLKNQPK